MENQKVFKTPSKTLARMQVVHFGKILFNLQFVVMAIMLASVITFVMPAIYYMMLLCIAFLSLFILFANKTFLSFWSGGETLTKIADILTRSWKYTVPIVLILAIGSIACLCFDKNQKQIARIVISAIVCVLALIVLILKLINKGGA